MGLSMVYGLYTSMQGVWAPIYTHQGYDVCVVGGAAAKQADYEKRNGAPKTVFGRMYNWFYYNTSRYGFMVAPTSATYVDVIVTELGARLEDKITESSFSKLDSTGVHY